MLAQTAFYGGGRATEGSSCQRLEKKGFEPNSLQRMAGIAPEFRIKKFPNYFRNWGI
ncbi:MAG TPA: hypothetical protein VIH09_05705 [Flavobacterium sp.]|uniref:hypothetical protein n=1 Tax=Flavobacterium sp. TaxID=239 RepID=UPI002F425C0D